MKFIGFYKALKRNRTLYLYRLQTLNFCGAKCNKLLRMIILIREAYLSFVEY